MFGGEHTYSESEKGKADEEAGVADEREDPHSMNGVWSMGDGGCRGGVGRR